MLVVEPVVEKILDHQSQESPGGGGAGGGKSNPPTPSRGEHALHGTSSGGGGGGGTGGPGPDAGQGGNGAGGRVVIRYQIGNDGSAVSPKGASGGLISTYNGNVIHTFLESGSLVCPGPFSETVTYVLVGGGGGSGGYIHGGAGGAGGYRTGNVPINWTINSNSSSWCWWSW